MNEKRTKTVQNWIITLVTIIMISMIVKAAPSGPNIKYVSHTTRTSFGGGTAESNSSHIGGLIVVMNFTSTSQNTHWKAYVGNISGTLVLDEPGGYTIYQWAVAQAGGEVYASRTQNIVWSRIMCANISHVTTECVALNHTPQYLGGDNITATFDDDLSDHKQFIVGNKTFAADACAYTTDLYVNDSGLDNYWEETLIFDNSTSSLIYVSTVNSNGHSFITNKTYDYQIILPEQGDAESYGTVTTYYFFLELT